MSYEASAELYEPTTLTPPNLESIAITPERSTLSPGDNAAVYRHGHLQRRQYAAACLGDLEFVESDGGANHQRCEQSRSGLGHRRGNQSSLRPGPGA